MPNEGNKILEYKHGEKSSKVPSMVLADLESLLQKIHSCQNNPEKLTQKEKPKRTPSDYSWLHVVHLMHEKTNGVITEGKTLWKCFVKT